MFTFVPDTAKMTVSLLQAAVDLRKPGKDICLNCHTKAGGGDNFKRGDISEAHRTATTALDVHMAPSSAGRGRPRVHQLPHGGRPPHRGPRRGHAAA